MIYKKIKFQVDKEIYCGFYIEHDEEKKLLKALIAASYDLAEPVGLGWLHYKEEQSLGNIERFIKWENINNKHEPIVHLDYISGRRCKTWIFRRRKGFLFLCDGRNEKEIVRKVQEYLELDNASSYWRI